MKRLIFSILFLAATLPGLAAAQGTLDLSPATQNSDGAEAVEVEVSASFAAGVLGGEFRVDYDSSVVHLSAIKWEASYGDDPLLRCPGDAVIAGARGCRGDHAFLAMGHVNGLPSGSVANLVFLPVGQGTSEVNLVSVSPFSDLMGGTSGVSLGQAEIIVVPEPAFAGGLLLGALGLAGSAHRRRRRVIHT